MKSSKIAGCGLLIALALIFSYIEARLPVFFYVPGMKLGLSNIVVLTALYRYDARTAFFINLSRIMLASFMFTSMFSLLYSLAGAALSFIVMLLLKKSGHFSMAGVSAAGGVSHNIGQILVAMLVLSDKLLYYLPALLLSGLATGLLIGLLGALIVRRLPAGI